MARAAFVSTGDVYADYIKTDYNKHINRQHYHESYEIYLQLDGARYIFYDDICYTMKRGDMAVMSPFDVHYSANHGTGYERIVINFTPEGLKNVLSDEEIYALTKKLRTCILHLDDERIELFKVLFWRIKHYMDEGGFLKQKMLFTSILQFAMAVIESGSSEVARSERISDPIMKVIKYISNHYREDITVDALADIAHMSKYYFCRRFKLMTGATAMEFLNNIRLTKVHNLLTGTALGIEEIADRTGFTSAINLLRAFKKVYGMTPSEFRKRNSK